MAAPDIGGPDFTSGSWSLYGPITLIALGLGMLLGAALRVLEGALQ